MIKNKVAVNVHLTFLFLLWLVFIQICTANDPPSPEEMIKPLANASPVTQEELTSATLQAVVYKHLKQMINFQVIQ